MNGAFRAKGRVAGLALAVALLVALVLAAYWQAPANSFHFDDFDNIVDHPPVRMSEFSTAALWQAFTRPFLASRPLPSLSFALDWWRGAGKPAAFLWTNLALHAANAALVLAFLAAALRRRETGNSGWTLAAAAIAAALWAAHPIQVQAVSYIVQRMTLLAALFMLLSVVCYLRGRLTGGWSWFAGAALAFAAGALCKENAWITPALWWLAEYGLLRREARLLRGGMDRLVFALPFVLVALVVVDFYTGQGPLANRLLPGYALREFSFEERLFTQPRVLLFHLSQVLWPLPERFSLEHEFALSRGWLTPPVTLAAIAAVLAWCAAGLWLLFRQGGRIAGFFVLWLPVTLAVESSVVSLEMVFEHRMYLPSVGLAGLAALALAALRRPGLRAAAVALAVLVVLGLGWATGERVKVWRNELTLYGDALRHAPRSARVLSVYGEALLEAGRRDEAEQALGQALALDPKAAVALEKLGVILFDRGDLTGADRMLRRALELRGAKHSILNHMGEIYMQTEAYEVARDMFAQAAAIAPGLAIYRWNLALALERLGDCAGAEREWRHYLSLDPSSDDRADVEAHLREMQGAGGVGCSGAR